MMGSVVRDAGGQATAAMASRPADTVYSAVPLSHWMTSASASSLQRHSLSGARTHPPAGLLRIKQHAQCSHGASCMKAARPGRLRFVPSPSAAVAASSAAAAMLTWVCKST